MKEKKHTDSAIDPSYVPGAQRTGAVFNGAACFHEVAIPLFEKQPDLVEWCPLCGARKVYGQAWCAPWLVAVCAIKARDRAEGGPG